MDKEAEAKALAEVNRLQAWQTQKRKEREEEHQAQQELWRLDDKQAAADYSAGKERRAVSKAKGGRSLGGRGSAGSRPRNLDGTFVASKSQRVVPPPTDAEVKRAAPRKRVTVKEATVGTHAKAEATAPLREGSPLSPAARKDPFKANEEREKLWARLGASPGGTGKAKGYAHLLEVASGTAGGGGDDEAVGSGRGAG